MTKYDDLCVVFNALRGGENLWNNRCVLIVFVISWTDYTICFFSWNVAKPFLNCLPNSLAFRCESIRMTPGNKDTGNPGYSWVNCSSEKIVMIHLHRPTLFALTVALKGSWKEQTWVCGSTHKTPGNKDRGNVEYLWDEMYNHLFTLVILNVMSIAMHTSYLY